MKIKDEDTLNLLIKHEETIQKLYEAYTQVFLTEKDFWSHLALEEAHHAAQLKTLTEYVQKGELYMDAQRYKPDAIHSSLTYIEERIADTKNEEITLKRALSIAMDIERGLLEHKYFQIFNADPVYLKEVLEELQAETQAHFKRVKEKWQTTEPVFT